jgi:ParB family transcriptional regulator, chromosome partitioning protein
MSTALLLSLKAFRVQVAEVAIASKPELAYDLLVFSTAQRLIAGESAGGLDIKLFNKTPHFSETKGTPAAITLADIKGNLPLDWLEDGTEAEQFADFQKLKPEQKAAILAYCVALTLEPALAPDTAEQITGYDAALAQSGFDIAAYWRPTAENYLSRIPTAQLLDIGRKILGGGPQWALEHKNAKKAVVVKILHDAFAVSGKPDTLDAIKAWLPEGMAFTLPEPANDKTKKSTKPRKAA